MWYNLATFKTCRTKPAQKRYKYSSRGKNFYFCKGRAVLILQFHWLLPLATKFDFCSPDCFSLGGTHGLGTKLVGPTVSAQEMSPGPAQGAWEKLASSIDYCSLHIQCHDSYVPEPSHFSPVGAPCWTARRVGLKIVVMELGLSTCQVSLIPRLFNVPWMGLGTRLCVECL